MSSSVLTSTSSALWIGPWPPAHNMRAAVEGRMELQTARAPEPLADQIARHGLVVVHLDGREDESARLADLMNDLEQTAATGVFIVSPQSAARAALAGRSGQFVCVDEDASPGELWATLSAAQRLGRSISELRRQIEQARSLQAKGEELDEEMRLAARLQRDFLPRRLPEVGPVRFGVLYRPASWVSGDIYDVTRLDETHIGFYVADVVGHGMPAALLTMFIKKALQTKRIIGNTYEIVPPHVTLATLNADICQQNLSSCHFCTALYCVLNTESLELTYCRAGHPEPILARADGSTSRPTSPGSLLGVFPDEEFVSNTIRLAPGDRMILYTDGAEDALRTPAVGELPLEQVLRPWLRLGRDELLLRLTGTIDDQAGVHRPTDDATVIVLDVLTE